jgi:phosphate transport system permease protein
MSLRTDPPRDDLNVGDVGRSLDMARLPQWAVPALGAVAIILAALLKAAGNSWGLGILIAWAVFTIVLVGTSLGVEGTRRGKDRAATVFVWTCLTLALLPLGSLLWLVIKEGGGVVNGTFLSSSMRNVIGPGGGIYHALWGTVIVTGLAAVMSVPIGIFTAVYLVEYGRGWLARWITFLIDVMTGIPSIVAGLFAYALFAIFLGEGVRMGFGGSVALSVLMIPLVVRASEEMLKLVPNELREASYALGVAKWRTIAKVVVPTALAGIVTGITIAIARVIGETAPLLIICGSTDSTNFNPFSGRMMTLPVFIFNSYKQPGVPPEFSIERAWGAALVLTILIMVLNLIARLISYVFSPKTKQ